MNLQEFQATLDVLGYPNAGSEPGHAHAVTGNWPLPRDTNLDGKGPAPMSWTSGRVRVSYRTTAHTCTCEEYGHSSQPRCVSHSRVSRFTHASARGFRLCATWIWTVSVFWMRGASLPLVR
jgi:hypothetical protein